MSLLNEFLNKSRETGRLEVTAVRLGGPTPVVDLFVTKLAALTRKVAPAIKVKANKPVDLRSLVPAGTLKSSDLSTVNWSAAVAKSPALTGREPIKSATLVDEMLDEYANLHSAAHAVYTKVMHLAPACGLGLAAGVSSGLASPDVITKMSTSYVGFNRAIDSIFVNSFAEAHAISEFARTYGSKLALELIDAVEQNRASAGEFSLYSTSSQSFDTQGALNHMRMEIEAGAIYGRLGRDDLVNHALAIAAESAGTWLVKHGAGPSMAESIVERISITSRGLSSPKQALEQDNDAKIKQEQSTRPGRPLRA